MLLHFLISFNFEIVPEIEESGDISALCSQITDAFPATTSDDPFEKAPMPKLGSPLTPRPSND